MSGRVMWAIALADFRERRRRPGYAVVLLAAVGLGYLAAPAAGAHWTIVNAGAYRGVYNSAYIGAVTALAGALWLSVAGFYVVRTAVARDERTGVGQLLAATSMPTPVYLLGRLLGNLLVLGSMAGALAGTALVMQLARGESRAVDPVALLLPFVVFTLPVLALVSAAAVVFETTPVLRSGFGNVVWFVVALIVMIAGQSANAPLGGLGVHVFAAAMRDQFAAQGVSVTEVAIGLMYLDDPARAIPWSGFDVTAGFAGQRGLAVLLALAVAAVPALWFGRFDPARGRVPAAPAAPTVHVVAPQVGYQMVLPKAQPRRGRTFRRLVMGEFRILTAGLPIWWWLGAAALVVAGAAAPARAGGFLLMAAWLWPVLVWSRLGTRAVESGVDGLLGAYPSPVRRVLAQWLAGLALTALVGAGAAVRLAAAGELGWAAGAAFVPALALALGVVSRSHRLFQALYLPLWYAVLNDLRGLDYLGALPGGPPPARIAVVAALLVAAALTVTAVRHARR